MALNGTMVKIETVTVGSGGAANITFTNIPQTYTDLQIVISGRTTSNVSSEQWVFGEFNINGQGVGTNLSGRALSGRASAESFTAAPRFYMSSSAATASTFGSATITIPNYTSSSNKSISIDSVSEDNSSTGAFLALMAGLWSQTAAITSIAFTPRSGSGNFAEYTTATLYGISRTTAQIKATGGMVYDTDTHVYHLFNASGVFTPLQDLTVDYLVVAGGGGGGSYGGGGGAGGLRSTVTATGGGGSLPSALSLTANTGYTVTIGAGGAGGAAAGSNKGSSGNNSVFSSITSTGGGGGGAFSAERNGINGGSGGGGGMDDSGNPTPTGGTGTSNEGFAGGNGVAGTGTARAGGGGGGAGAAGVSGSGIVAGNGGAGVSTSITGTSVFYAGGGGGTFDSRFSGGTVGLGGSGGGGNGATNSSGFPGTANTGGGGGAGTYASNFTAGGAGGSGIVIVRYAK